jgi:chemotaxis-related protein WspB
VLCLLLRVGADQYAIPVRSVVQVLPVVDLKTVPQAAHDVAGVFSYHGTPVPVIDLCARATGLPARRHLDSRIVIVSVASAPRDPGAPRDPLDPLDPSDPRDPVVGVLVEHATNVMRCSPSDFRDPGVAAASYLGPVTHRHGTMVQLIDPARLIEPVAVAAGAAGGAR